MFQNEKRPKPDPAGALCRIRSILRCVCFFLSLSGAAFPAFASQITLQVSSETRVSKEAQAICTVSVTNRGDEAALRLQLTVESAGRRLTVPPVDSLAPGETRESRLTIPTDALMIGRHFLIILLDYTDGNGYPFSASSYSQFIIGEDIRPQVEGSIPSLEMDQTASMDLQLRSLDAKVKKVRLRLVLPKEITASLTLQDAELAPSGSKNIPFDLSNLTAMPGSSYAIFALAEYTEAARHTGLIIPSTITIRAEIGFFQRYRVILWAAAALLALLMVAAQFYSRRRTAGKSKV